MWQYNKVTGEKKYVALVVLIGSRVDATTVVDIALPGPTGKIRHLIRVEFP
jgi:hypothetical protein